MAIMRPQIISKETIKPSSPTPYHLRNYSLSLLDQLVPHIYLPMVLFYPNTGFEGAFEPANIINVLKKSLSETLARYYPFAGRLVNKVCVECNDEGVDFFEARMACGLSEFLEKLEPESVDLFYPDDVLWNESYKGSLVVIQVTFFDCGGMAISTSMLHKIADGSTNAAFFTDWACMTRHQPNKDPKFISMSILPPDEAQMVPEAKLVLGNNCVTRILIFEDPKISLLKETVTESGVKNPTRVEVVIALIYKCAMAITTKKSLGQSKPSILLEAVNLRQRVVPAMPENCIGNFAWFFSAMPKDENDKKLHNLVGSLKRGMTEFFDKYTKNASPDECYTRVCESIKGASGLLGKTNDAIDVYKSSSLCRYPFNQVNFGWGKPIWAATSSSAVKNTFLLKDSPAGGIEAWVTLEREDMAIFECDEELLAFASLNPTAFGASF